MSVTVKTIVNWFVGWFLIIVGVSGIILPILPGWIFIFMGAFLLGWITKKQLREWKKKLKKDAEKNKQKVKEKEERVKHFFWNSLMLISQGVLGLLVLLTGIAFITVYNLLGLLFVFLGSGLIGWTSKERLEQIKEEILRKTKEASKLIKRKIK